MLALLPLAVAAQETLTPQTFERLQQKYVSSPGFTMVRITSEMLKASGMSDISDVKDIRIVTSENYNPSFVKEMARVTKQTGFKLLISYEGKDQNTRFYFRTLPDGRVSDLIMASWGYKDNLIMSIRGNFLVSQIRSIASRVSSPRVTVSNENKEILK